MTARTHACLIGTAVTTAVWVSSAVATEVRICTDVGPLTIELFDDKAPLHTGNFLEHVDKGYYQGTVFHRVIDGFMIQGGGYDRQLRQKPTGDPVANESENGLSNARGTVAAARTSDPDSATSQFYINLVDNSRLDGGDESAGYTVFGRVTEGLEHVDAIGALPTRAAGPFQTDVPDPLVGIKSMARLDRSVVEALPEATRDSTIRQRITDAVAASDQAATLEWIGHYRATCVAPDSDMLLTEARAAAAASKTGRAKAALDDYFAITTDAHDHYGAALELYETVAPNTEPNIAQTVGDCESPAPPDVPDGATAKLDEMVDGQSAVRSYMSESESYLDCLSEVIDAKDISEEQQGRAVQEHNRMVAAMEQLAEEFNTQVRAFKARE
jgi:cyclophilin family peptidyl-prolyl cis-trans isomerase